MLKKCHKNNSNLRCANNNNKTVIGLYCNVLLAFSNNDNRQGQQNKKTKAKPSNAASNSFLKSISKYYFCVQCKKKQKRKVIKCKLIQPKESKIGKDRIEMSSQ